MSRSDSTLVSTARIDKDLHGQDPILRSVFAVLAAVLFVSLITGRSAKGVTDYIYFAVNGDTSSSAVAQGDTLGWAANCDTGSAIHWDIWFDVDSDSVLDSATDVLIESYNVIDGDQFEGRDFCNDEIWPFPRFYQAPMGDDNSVPDGWCSTAGSPIGLPPGDYIFSATNLTEGGSAERLLTVRPFPSPQGMVRGRIVVSGHPAPDSAILANHLVCADASTSAEPEDRHTLFGLTNANGEYELIDRSIGPYHLVGIRAPRVSGFSPTEAATGIGAYAGGIVYAPDLLYETPQDSVYGRLLDDSGQVIGRAATIYTDQHLQEGLRAYDGRYAIYLMTDSGPLSHVDQPRPRRSDLIPEYMYPFSQCFYDVEHSIEYDIVCPRADTSITLVVTENGGLPTRQYLIYTYSDSLWAGTATVSGIGVGNTATLHVSSRHRDGWELRFGNSASAYPFPDSIWPHMIPPVPMPGDTVLVDWRSKYVVIGDLIPDPMDQPGGPIWEGFDMRLTNPLGSYSGTVAEGSDTFRLLSPPGLSEVRVSSDDYLACPNALSLEVTGDTTGGFGITLNRRTWTVTGRLVYERLPDDGSIKRIYARTGLGNSGYLALTWANKPEETYSLRLCDGAWTIGPEEIEGYVTPQPYTLTVGHDTGTTVVDFVYTVITDVDEQDDDQTLPRHFLLAQNYPNPFNPETTIEFDVPARSYVELNVYNVLGQRVKTLVEVVLPAGGHSATWDGTDENGNRLASGMYLYRLRTGDILQTRKMLLLN